MTPAALASPWVQREVNVALNELTAGRMRGVIPFVVMPCEEQVIPLVWRTLHRYDATKAYQPARDRLVQAIGLAVPSAASGSPLPVPAGPSTPALDAAISLHLARAEKYRKAGDRSTEGLTLINLGDLLRDRGRKVEAEHYYKQALAIFEAIGAVENADRVRRFLERLGR
jgi:hypothetical protein